MQLSTSTVSVLGMSVIYGLNSALDTLTSQGWTSDSPKQIGLHAQRQLLISGMILIPILILLWNARPVLLLLRQDPEVADIASRVLKIHGLFLVPFAVHDVTQRWLAAQSRVRIATGVLLGELCCPLCWSFPSDGKAGLTVAVQWPALSVSCSTGLWSGTIKWVSSALLWQPSSRGALWPLPSCSTPSSSFLETDGPASLGERSQVLAPTSNLGVLALSCRSAIGWSGKSSRSQPVPLVRSRWRACPFARDLVAQSGLSLFYFASLTTTGLSPSSSTPSSSSFKVL